MNKYTNWKFRGMLIWGLLEEKMWPRRVFRVRSEMGQKTDAGGVGKEEEPMGEAEKASLSECVKTYKAPGPCQMT